jgi:hypothetical protein
MKAGAIFKKCPIVRCVKLPGPKSTNKQFARKDRQLKSPVEILQLKKRKKVS